MTMEEMQKRLQERNALYDRVFSGEKVICPLCNNGNLKPIGKTGIFCDCPGCRMKVSFDPIRS